MGVCKCFKGCGGCDVYVDLWRCRYVDKKKVAYIYFATTNPHPCKMLAAINLYHHQQTPSLLSPPPSEDNDNKVNPVNKLAEFFSSFHMTAINKYTHIFVLFTFWCWKTCLQRIAFLSKKHDHLATNIIISRSGNALARIRVGHDSTLIELLD